MKIVYNLIYFIVIATPGLLAQNPTHYPTPGTEPIVFTPVRVLVYIVFPVLLVGIYLWLRWKRRQN